MPISLQRLLRKASKSCRSIAGHFFSLLRSLTTRHRIAEAMRKTPKIQSNTIIVFPVILGMFTVFSSIDKLFTGSGRGVISVEVGISTDFSRLERINGIERVYCSTILPGSISIPTGNDNPTGIHSRKSTIHQSQYRNSDDNLRPPSEIIQIIPIRIVTCQLTTRRFWMIVSISFPLLFLLDQLF